MEQHYPKIDNLEKSFQRIEQESERRAKIEEEAMRKELSDGRAESSKLSERQRRRASVTISRVGQGVVATHPSITRAASQFPLATTRSAFYKARGHVDSTDSFASVASNNSYGKFEDEQHVTQMHQIAGRSTLSRALSKRLSRSNSAANILSTEDTSLVIGVSVEEATVESAGHKEAQVHVPRSTVVAGSVKQSSSQTVESKGLGGKWASRVSQKLRRKSKADTEPPT